MNAFEALRHVVLNALSRTFDDFDTKSEEQGVFRERFEYHLAFGLTGDKEDGDEFGDGDDEGMG